MTALPSGQAPDNPLDALLAGYACGVLNAPLHALVGSHLALTTKNRAFVAGLEAANGSLLNAAEPCPIRDRDAKLAAIFAQDPDPILTVPRHPSAAAAGLPAPLARYLGMDLGDVPWRTLLPGVREFKVEENQDGDASLLWIRAGRRMPAHTHEGSEVTLVLNGAFSDLHGHYGRGDIAIADSEIDHRPIADPGEDCLCFAVTDAPLRLTGPIGRIVQRFLGR